MRGACSPRSHCPTTSTQTPSCLAVSRLVNPFPNRASRSSLGSPHCGRAAYTGWSILNLFPEIGKKGTKPNELLRPRFRKRGPCRCGLCHAIRRLHVTLPRCHLRSTGPASTIYMGRLAEIALPNLHQADRPRDRIAGSDEVALASAVSQTTTSADVSCSVGYGPNPACRRFRAGARVSDYLQSPQCALRFPAPQQTAAC